MIKGYAKIIVNGSPISKSNFKLFNLNGRAILPNNSGRYHDRYALYEEEIAYEARVQNPDVVLTESLIAVLKVYYKSEKRHPDTNNITKSIFDGIEKSGVIINDAQITRLIIEEYYDKINPRFELELFAESKYFMEYSLIERDTLQKPKEYLPPSNKRTAMPKDTAKANCDPTKLFCDICGTAIKADDAMSANRGAIQICKQCFNKLF